jgi:hypothetical protein
LVLAASAAVAEEVVVVEEEGEEEVVERPSQRLVVVVTFRRVAIRASPQTPRLTRLASHASPLSFSHLP